MTTTRIPFETYMRKGAVDLLTDFRQEFDIKLQIYPARPRSIAAPCAFIDRLREAIDFDGAFRRRVCQVDVIVCHGLFDGKDTAEQRDAFVDNFVEWTTDRPHAAYGTTVMEPRSIEDDPAYVPEWIESPNTYYASTIILEGFAGGL